MKKKWWGIFLCLFLLQLAAATEAGRLIFQKANRHFMEKEYEAALSSYIQLLGQDYNNFAINYNIGCSYYKLNQLGQARFYFERALFFKPFNKELFNNLKVIYKQLYDNPLNGEQEIMNIRLIFFIPIEVLSILFCIFFVLAVIHFILFFMQRNKIFFIICIICICFNMITTFFFITQYNEYHKKIAVITQDETHIYLQPYSDTVITHIDTGTKALFIDAVEEFIKISFADGTTGWIKKKYAITN